MSKRVISGIEMGLQIYYIATVIITANDLNHQRFVCDGPDSCTDTRAVHVRVGGRFQLPAAAGLDTCTGARGRSRGGP